MKVVTPARLFSKPGDARQFLCLVEGKKYFGGESDLMIVCERVLGRDSWCRTDSNAHACRLATAEGISLCGVTGHSS